ncbi:MAG: ABC transporter permease [Acidobacteriota bacterium]
MLLFTNALSQLWRDLRTQKLRTTLTTFGIVWGTVAVSLLLAFGQGLHKQLIRSAAGLGDRIVIAWPSRTSIPYEGLGKGRRINVSDEDLEAVRRDSTRLEALSAEYADSFKVHQGDKTMMVDVSGVYPEFGTMRNLIPRPGGRFLNPRDMAERRRVAFVGDEFAKDFFGAPDPVGRVFMVGDSPFTVVGVLQTKEQDSSYSGRDKDKMFIPSTTFRAVTGAKYVDNIIFKAHAPSQNKALSEEVRTLLAKRLRFSPEDKEALAIWDTTEMFEFMDAFMLGFQLFLGIVGSLTLVVGGIGVSNIMNVVVEERTREIGIKMALGAKSGFILRQFLLETLVITGLGGALGLLLSAGICSLFPKFGLTEYVGVPEISPMVAALTALALGAVGVLAGYFPARDAARLDPVIAMKL